MREAVMETPWYTLQIKAKPCKCFSTHFQETGRDGPRHHGSLASCGCLKMKMCALCTKPVENVFSVEVLD